MKAVKLPTAGDLERWPWAVRGLLGCGAACVVESLTYWVKPFHALPMALALPTVILCFWFLGMWGGVLCTLTEAILTDLLLLDKAQLQFPNANVPQWLRLTAFFGVSVVVGWMIRRLAQQRTQFETKELERQLMLAQAERQLAEERGQISNAMLRTEKLAVAGRLAAAVAHEINNPLEAVSNLLYLISIAETTEAARAHALQALDELIRVSLITQQTLMLHRQQGEPAAMRLSEAVAVALALFRPKLRDAGITVQVRAVRETGIACVPTETHQIFANLLSNAIDSMPHGGRLTVRARPSLDWRDGKTAGMRVTFSDTGVGMDRATMRRIFEPFFTTKIETGTGLGLWVVTQLVERHHGEVRAWSSQRAEASGTAFTIFLPYGETSDSGGSKPTPLTP
ncbi:MAG: HAMP domain-containing sensor histidine kinase [Terracidiphilus sp.]|jgi:signal transduction histidine kinase